ncbi:hypothetical protein F511_12714 [Dorcoceras hygrometricum]|uniref:Uncharacterized protein n=1 Tax=Dorcoceras hygrometricum TaxID=472368 RepID=A0A2Z7DBK5_9LAMI|nr:hypothetical protein F511_12714 [Dorcoceras hygrometricum]
MGPQPLRLWNHNSGLAHRIMVKRLATKPHDPLGITDSACKNQLVVDSVQYGPLNPYIPIRSTTIGKSRVAIDLIAMHTSWRSNSDIASVTRAFKRITLLALVPGSNRYYNNPALLGRKQFPAKRRRRRRRRAAHGGGGEDDVERRRRFEDLGLGLSGKPGSDTTVGDPDPPPARQRKNKKQMAVDPSIRSTTGIDLPPISLHYKAEGFYRQWILLEKLGRKQFFGEAEAATAVTCGARRRRREDDVERGRRPSD